ncbi:MAG TPA: AMP-binding protein, partial [Acidimicrobiia bacterium]|nr:AMP-binding protein [Acidimicrobiia bacterium]
PPAETEEGMGALTLSGFLLEVTRRHAEREALVFHEPDGGVVRWTYRDLERETRRVARAVLGAGAGKDGRVAILLGNRPEWVTALYGVALAGAVAVPLNTYFEPPELDYVLRHSDAQLLLTQTRLLGHAYVDQLVSLCPELPGATPGELRSPRFPHLRRVAALGLDERLGAVEPWETFLRLGGGVAEDVVDAAAAEVTSADHALVIYTSGTTAVPKGVLHPHRGPAIQSWRFAQQLRLDPSVRVWSAFPFFWSAGLVMVMGATLAAGGCIVLQEHFEPGEALHLLESERVTSPHAWAHQLAELEDHPDWPEVDLSSIRHCEAFTSFGRHPSVHVEDAWSPRAAYGLSETCTIISSLPVDTPREIRERSQGVILPGNLVRIVDRDTGEALPVDAIGEITVKGPTLMLGYVKKLPEECFDEDGYFHTGDAGYVDAEGYLHWTGRMTDMIKTGGANVSPVEIEETLLRHPGLKAALAVGIPDAKLGEMVVLCAVAHDGASVDEDDVRSFLRGRVASYKIPRRVLFFREAELSLTGNAKIRADELRKLAMQRLSVTS